MKIIIINRQKNKVHGIVYMYIIKIPLQCEREVRREYALLSFVCQEGVMGVYYVVVTGSCSSSSKIVHVYIYCVE